MPPLESHPSSLTQNAPHLPNPVDYLNITTPSFPTFVLDAGQQHGRAIVTPSPPKTMRQRPLDTALYSASTANRKLSAIGLPYKPTLYNFKQGIRKILKNTHMFSTLQSPENRTRPHLPEHEPTICHKCGNHSFCVKRASAILLGKLPPSFVSNISGC